MRPLRMFIKLFICLLPTIWAAGLTWLSLHMGWLEQENSVGLWVLFMAVLAVAQVIFMVIFLGILQEDESTESKQL